jgi:hypothetical protein
LNKNTIVMIHAGANIDASGTGTGRFAAPEMPLSFGRQTP